MIKIKVVNQSDFPLPKKQTKGSSGIDLHADIENPRIMEPNKVEIIPTGIYIEVPEDYEAQVRARSGLSANHGIILVNGIGTIDSDYRGEIKVIMMNVSRENYTISPGDRIAQLVVVPIAHFELEEVKELSDLKETERNNQGFGHTGK